MMRPKARKLEMEKFADKFSRKIEKMSDSLNQRTNPNVSLTYSCAESTQLLSLNSYLIPGWFVDKRKTKNKLSFEQKTYIFLLCSKKNTAKVDLSSLVFFLAW